MLRLLCAQSYTTAKWKGWNENISLVCPNAKPPFSVPHCVYRQQQVLAGPSPGVISEVLLALSFYHFRLSVMDISGTWKWNQVEEIK